MSHTFKLQSFSTSSAFDPHIVDEARYISQESGNNFNRVRSSGPIFRFISDQLINFIGIKWDRYPSTVNSLSFPLREIYINESHTQIQGEIAFYTLLGFTVTRLVGTENISFTLNNSSIDSDYVTINFPSIVLPAAVYALPDNIPIYVAIKLISLAPNDSLTTNAQVVELKEQQPLYTGFSLLEIESDASLVSSYDISNVQLVINLETIPELYVEELL